MLYILAIIFPPLAVLLSGFRPISFIFSIVLTMLLWIPGIIHAILVVNDHKANKRVKKQTKKLIKAQKAQ